jgi:release factor glutamine methyltransferase
VLRAAGVDTPERDARLLTAAALGIGQLDLIASPDRWLSPAEAARFAEHLRRRAQREPVSRILGRRAFYGREFAITPVTLDPRPDTETLVELALEIADEQGWRSRAIRIVDIGTGSGCILLTLLAELPLATGLGTDIDPAALEVAAANAAQLGLSDRVRFTPARSLAGLNETFDLLVSNPPYIPSGEIPGLEPEVRHYDPPGALDGGPDGLDIFREIARDLRCAVPHGWAVFEVGAGQAEKVVEILDPGHHGVTRVRRDLAAHQRCVAVWTQN